MHGTEHVTGQFDGTMSFRTIATDIHVLRTACRTHVILARTTVSVDRTDSRNVLAPRITLPFITLTDELASIRI